MKATDYDKFNIKVKSVFLEINFDFINIIAKEQARDQNKNNARYMNF